VTVTFVVGSPDTITRAAGSFIDDGFEAGMVVTVSGTLSNDGDHTIAAGGVAALTLTLESVSTVTGEVGIAATFNLPYTCPTDAGYYYKIRCMVAGGLTFDGNTGGTAVLAGENVGHSDPLAVGKEIDGKFSRVKLEPGGVAYLYRARDNG
jgi:hypothetical protein